MPATETTQRTHCQRGHPLADAYIRVRPNGGLQRQCRQCTKERVANWKKEQRELLKSLKARIAKLEGHT